MNTKILVTCFVLFALTLTGAAPRHALADHRDEPWENSDDRDDRDDRDKHKKPRGELVEVVRESTRRFRDVVLAEAEGYHLLFGCVTGPDEGAMGLHYVNMALVGDGVLDATRPEIVIYEPRRNGRVRLIGADYLVLADAWHENNASPPQLMGQLFHLFESPNRFGLPDFYTLHVWAWKKNPAGQFTNWHTGVSCESFDGQAN